MSTLLKSLGAMSQTQKEHIERAAQISLESELAELHEQVEQDLEEMLDVSADIATKTDDTLHTAATTQTLSDLVEETIDTYGANGLSEQAAELLKISAEAVLKSCKLDISVDAIVPSFESNMTFSQYSAEATEKKDSFVARVVRWVIEAFKSLYEVVKDFVNRFRTNCDSVERYTKKVKEKVTAFKGAQGKEVNPGKNAIYLTDGKGKYLEPAAAIRANMADYQKFAQQWDMTFGNLTKIDNVKKAADITNDVTGPRVRAQIEAVLYDLRSAKLNGIHFIQTHTITVDTSNDAHARMTGAKMHIDMTAKEPTGKPERANKNDMTAGVDAALASIDVMRKIQKQLDGWMKTASDMNKASNQLLALLTYSNKFGGAPEEQIADVLKIFKELVAANNIMIAGWTRSIPAFLTSVKANVRYIEMSASGSSEAVLKTVDNFGNRTDQLALGHS